MKSRLLFVVLCTLWVSIALAQPQTFVIQSLEGTPTKISLRDLGRETAMVSCEKSKLFIHDFWSLDTITVEKQCFLKIRYNVRGGSDLGLQNTLLLAVSKGKIVVPFFIFSEERSSLKALDSEADTVLYDEKTFYHVQLSVSGNSIKNYKVIAKVKDISKSKVEAKNNYNWYRQVILKFDNNNEVFCNGYTTLNQRFNIVTGNYPWKSSFKTIKGAFPSVLIKKPRGRYVANYCIDGQWYEKGGKNKLIACY